jgi:hypothetical protein
MRLITAVPVLVALAAATAPLATHAAQQRSFVASFGLDTANCQLATPCRSFNVAIANTNPGGEVVILDTAGYGPMTITKSIKVIGPAGVYGGISVLGGANPTTGIVINAADGDDVTLRGLDVSGITGAVPAPLIGIDIQNAGGVHIEKSSIGNFTDGGGACINVNTAKTIRIYVVDSFLRECRTGIYANGNTVNGNRSSVVVDNTRIERGKGPVSFGVWVLNHMSLNLRNSQITRQDVGAQVDVTVDGASASLDVMDSQFTRVTAGVKLTKTSANALTIMNFTRSQIASTDPVIANITGANSTSYLSLFDSEITNSLNTMTVSNSGVGSNTHVRVMNSHLGWNTNGIILTNTANSNTALYLDLVRTTMTNITNPMIDATATTGGRTYVNVEGSVFANTAGAVIRTQGDSQVSASLVRSQVHNCNTVVSHGSASGTVRIDGNHIVACTNDFVNNGNPGMVSFNNNMVHDVTNSGGFTYITPPTVAPR